MPQPRDRILRSVVFPERDGRRVQPELLSQCLLSRPRPTHEVSIRIVGLHLLRNIADSSSHLKIRVLPPRERIALIFGFTGERGLVRSSHYASRLGSPSS